MPERTMVAAMDVCVAAGRRMAALPAVATLDWADRAAECLGVLAEDALCVVMIGSLDEEGGIIRGHEAVGVSWAGATGRLRRACRELHAVSRHGSPANQADSREAGASHSAMRVRPRHEVEAAELTIRSKFERLRRLGWGVKAELPRPGVVGTIEEFDRTDDGDTGDESEASSELRGIWESVGVQEAVLGVTGLGSSVAGRFLLTGIGFAGEDGAQPGGSSVRAAVVIGAVRVLLPELASRAIRAVGETPATSSRWLTVREQQVLRELSLGKSVREIADELGRSPHTVHDHVKSLHRKLDASSRGELVARALGFTTDESADRETHQSLPIWLGASSQDDTERLAEVMTVRESIAGSVLEERRGAQGSGAGIGLGGGAVGGGAREIESGPDRSEDAESAGAAGQGSGQRFQRGMGRAKPLRRD